MRLALLLCLLPPLVDAGNPGLPPLTEIQSHQGHLGGLYPEDRNEPAKPHAEALDRMAALIEPLDAAGKPSPQGRIVVAGVGASVCRQIFAELEATGSATPGIHPAVTFVNCAKGGADVGKIADPRYWKMAQQALAQRGVTAAQVQVVWYQSDDLREQGTDFPGRPQRLKEAFAEQMRLIKQHFPNARLCYHSGRHTTAFLPDPVAMKKHAEPRAWLHGWAIKWLIEDQMDGDPALTFEGAAAKAPLSTWAGYFWTNGDEPRADGYQWTPADVKDGVHFSDAGTRRVTGELTTFWRTDPHARRWFAKEGSTSLAATPAAAPRSRAKPDSAPARDMKPQVRAAQALPSGEPALLINGKSKFAKLERLLATEGPVRMVVRDLEGKERIAVEDVFKQRLDLNEKIGPGEYRIEFFNAAGERIQFTQQVGEVLRLK
jgi:hypothetical protein